MTAQEEKGLALSEMSIIEPAMVHKGDDRVKINGVAPQGDIRLISEGQYQAMLEIWYQHGGKVNGKIPAGQSMLTKLTAVQWAFKDDVNYQDRILIVEKSGHPNGVKYAVMKSRWGSVWNKDGQWEMEPQPSSRDEAYYARCRYDTIEEAATAAVDARKQRDLEEYVRRQRQS